MSFDKCCHFHSQRYIFRKLLPNDIDRWKIKKVLSNDMGGGKLEKHFLMIWEDGNYTNTSQLYGKMEIIKILPIIWVDGNYKSISRINFV